MPTFRLPHVEEMYDHQIEWLSDPHRFKVICAHRRSRKTTTAIEKILLEAFHVPKRVYWIIFPTYNEAKDAIWKDPRMLFRIIPKELIKKTNEQELTIYLVNGSVICLKGADMPERLRGAGPYGVVFDEYAMMKPETWEGIIQPVLRENGGWAWFISTPKGRNHFWKLFLKGQEKSKEWRSWLLPVGVSGVIDEEELKNARDDMPEDLYQQEWECNFLEGEGAVFRDVYKIMDAEPKPPQEGHTYVMGGDLAKHRDFTVLAVYDRGTNTQVYQDRFRHLEWPFQKKKIIATANHYNQALCVLDATGLGDPIVDDLLRAGVSVEPYKFTQQTKKDLVEKLSIWIEQKKIRMLPIKETKREFESFSYEIGPTGRIHYQAPHREHDDIVIAHGLAVWQLTELHRERTIKPLTRLQLFYLEKKREAEGDDSYAEEKEWREWLST